MIAPDAVPLERVLGAEVGAIYRDIHLDHGVEMLLGTGVASFEGDGRVERVRTQDGRDDRLRRRRRRHRGDAPRRCSPPAAGLAVENGILVDERLETSAPGSSPPATSPTSSTPRSAGSASSTGTTRCTRDPRRRAACSARPRATRALPYFFSDQYDVGMEYSGHAADWDRVVFRGDPAAREFIAFWLAGRPRAGRDERQRVGRRRADPGADRERPPVDERRLADPDVPLEHVPRAAGGGVVNRLQRLHEAGVSIWLDTLSRDLLESGDFATLVDESAVTGATSNPTIFAKAITGSDRYDDQLRSLVAAGVRRRRGSCSSPIALDDVRRAAAILRPAYERSGGSDGFVSFECTPDVADDAEATIAQALDLWHRLDLPNVLIKVPATAPASSRSRS